MVPALQLSLRAAVAAVLAFGAAQLLQLPHPLYAMISAVIVTDLQPSETPKLAFPRLVGTMIGSTFGAAINTLISPSPWSLGLGIMIAMFTTQLISQPTAAKVAGYVCGIVLLDHGDAPWTYGFFRMVETALGIGAGMCVSVIPKLLRPKNREEAIGL
jgi:uncharacterized membrane protein YgaE (UPF0421/DUF939 family)